MNYLFQMFLILVMLIYLLKVINSVFNKWLSANQDNPMTTIEESKQHDFDTSLNLFHLKDEIDVEAEHQKELHNMLELMRW